MSFNLFDDVENSTSNLYDEKIDLISFFKCWQSWNIQKNYNKNYKNKIVKNSKIKEKSFSSKDIILIKIKRLRKFEMN